jgi:hypothetical protein
VDVSGPGVEAPDDVADAAPTRPEPVRKVEPTKAVPAVPAASPGGATPPIEPRAAEPRAAGAPASSASPAPTDPLDGAARVVASLAGSVVRVETWLCYHEGEAPRSLIQHDRELAEEVEAQRPLVRAGFVVEDGHVITEDLGIPSRFVARRVVVGPAGRLDAQPAAWLLHEKAAVLSLERGRAGLQPLTFRAHATPPLRALSLRWRGPGWSTLIRPAFEEIVVNPDGYAAARVAEQSLILDATDAPVGLTIDGWLGQDGGWRRSPSTRPSVGTVGMQRRLSDLAALARRTLLRVDLRMRSPAALGTAAGSWREERRREGLKTALTAVGVLLQPDLLLVPASMDVDAIERLESVRVTTPEGAVVEAQFAGGLRDLDAFLVRLPKALGKPLPVAQQDDVRTALSRDLVADLEVRMQGEQRAQHVTPVRLGSFVPGWRGHAKPYTEGDHADHFVFTLDGSLLALPIATRAPLDADELDRPPDPELFDARVLLDLLADRSEAIDPALTPATQGMEGRMAWLGVEVQALNPALARVHGVSALSDDGRYGVLVAHVYRPSPAARLGLVPGDVLLRLRSPGRSRPVEIVDPTDTAGTFEERHPELYGPDEVLSSAWNRPGWVPWPRAESALNRAMTELGVGRMVTLDWVREGLLREHALVIEASPPRFDTAPRLAAERWGVTFCDLTYESRRHFQLDAAAGGVIVARVDPGSPAAIAELRRFDVVLAIDGVVVTGCEDVARALGSPRDVELKVLDAFRERVVKVKGPPQEPTPK